MQLVVAEGHQVLLVEQEEEVQPDLCMVQVVTGETLRVQVGELHETVDQVEEMKLTAITVV